MELKPQHKEIEKRPSGMYRNRNLRNKLSFSR